MGRLRQCDCWRGALVSMRVVEEDRAKVAQVEDAIAIAMALSLSVSLCLSLFLSPLRRRCNASTQQRERDSAWERSCCVPALWTTTHLFPLDGLSWRGTWIGRRCPLIGWSGWAGPTSFVICRTRLTSFVCVRIPRGFAVQKSMLSEWNFTVGTLAHLKFHSPNFILFLMYEASQRLLCIGVGPPKIGYYINEYA